MKLTRFPIYCKYNPFSPVTDICLTMVPALIPYTIEESDSLSLPLPLNQLAGVLFFWI
jgi:hypothetical protein